MQISIDTRSKLGVLTSNRLVKIDSTPTYFDYVDQYREACSTGGPHAEANAREVLLSKAYNKTIKPGEPCLVRGAEHTNRGKYPGKDKLDAEIRWYPEMGIYLCPSGAPEDINQIFCVPGPDGIVVFKAVEQANPENLSGTWKRTKKGYEMEILIPWKDIKGYKPGWKRFPVDAVIDSRLPTGRVQIIMNSTYAPAQDAAMYAVLEPQ